MVQWTRDALGYVDGSRDPTILFNVKRRSSGLMSEIAWERAWQLYKFNWPNALVNVEFRHPVSGKIMFGPDVAVDLRVSGAQATIQTKLKSLASGRAGNAGINMI